jgi:Transposase IS66 family
MRTGSHPNTSTRSWRSGCRAAAPAAAGAQLGPRAVALAAWLSKGLAVPAGKIAKLLAQLGLGVTAGGVVQAVARAARRAQPTYQALVAGVRASPVVAPDETGWRVGGGRAWLWALVARPSGPKLRAHLAFG